MNAFAGNWTLISGKWTISWSPVSILKMLLSPPIVKKFCAAFSITLEIVALESTSSSTRNSRAFEAQSFAIYGGTALVDRRSSIEIGESSAADKNGPQSFTTRVSSCLKSETSIGYSKLNKTYILSFAINRASQVKLSFNGSLSSPAMIRTSIQGLLYTSGWIWSHCSVTQYFMSISSTSLSLKICSNWKTGSLNSIWTRPFG